MPHQRSTGEITLSLTKEALIQEALRIEENSLYTSKGHFVAARLWKGFHLWLGIPTTMMAALAGVLSFSTYNIGSGILSIIVAILTSLSTFLNPKERANSHFIAGNNHDSLLGRVRMFRTIDCRREDSEEILTSRLKELSEQREHLNRDCPQIPSIAYNIAKKGIEAGEASYMADKISIKDN
jgi:hypothetical protein